MELIGSGYWLPPPLSVAQADSSTVTRGWPVSCSGHVSLASTTYLFAPDSWAL